MSVRSEVRRAGRTVSPDEFPRIIDAALATVDITQLHEGDHLLRGDDAEALRSARFRNADEQRQFYITFLSQARDRVLSQIARAFASEVAAHHRIDCGASTRATSTPNDASCFDETGGELTLPPSTPSTYVNGLLRYLGQLLPVNSGFVGLRGAASDRHLAAIQLFDGVFFTMDNVRSSGLPEETQISAEMIRYIYRASFCEADRSATSDDSLAICR